MKSIIKLGITLVCSFILVGCNNNSDKQDQKSMDKPKDSIVKQEDHSSEVKDSTFKNGVLETPEYRLTIDKTQVGHNNFNDDDGLIIWYTVENKSEYNVKPQDMLSWFEVTQTDGASQYEITTDYNFFNSEEALFPMYTDGAEAIEDVDAYNEAIEEQEKFKKEFIDKGRAELLPGKKVTAAIGLQLQNTTYPVTFKLINGTSVDESEYKINLT